MPEHTYESRAQCEGTTFGLDRRKRPVRDRCRNYAVPGSTRCKRHVDPNAVGKVEQAYLEAERRKRANRHARWTVARLARLKEDRQLDLFVWGDAYDLARVATIRRLIDEYVEEDAKPPPYDASDWLWRQYIDRQERRQRDRESFEVRLDAACAAAAERAVLTHGLPSWQTLRSLVYERDGGVCFVCGKSTPWEYYELGHLHDRCAGGSDHPENVVVMCVTCNRLQKPVHHSRADAIAWAKSTRSFNGWRRSAPPLREVEWEECLAYWEGLPEQGRNDVLRSALDWGSMIEDVRRELTVLEDTE